MTEVIHGVVDNRRLHFHAASSGPVHKIGVAGDADHWMRGDLAGFDDPEAVSLVEAPGASVGGIVDQAQAIEPQPLGTFLSMGEKLHAQPPIAPAFMQGQAGDVQGCLLYTSDAADE